VFRREAWQDDGQLIAGPARYWIWAADQPG